LPLNLPRKITRAIDSKRIPVVFYRLQGQGNG
jgi:hypothetical protein